MTDQFPKFRIESGSTGMGTRTWMDDKEMTGLTGIAITIGLDSPNAIQFATIVNGLQIDLRGNVQWEVHMADPWDRSDLVGMGATPPAALRALADTMEGRNSGLAVS